MGKKDVVKHSRTRSHLEQARAMSSQSRLTFSGQSSEETLRRTAAELKMAVVAAASNIPLAFHDRLSPTIRSVFPDSKLASKYHSASTKATCMLNGAIAPTLKSELLNKMKVQPFSICVDGSNDRELQKMNPVTVRIHDEVKGRIVTQFLDMCLSSSSTAADLYKVIDGKLAQLLECENTWDLCTSVGIDNTSVNIGVRDSLKTRITARNSSVYFCGCPCHIIHNTAQKAAEAFTQSCGFDVEEFTIDLFYWFDKSTKRKNELLSFCQFCDQEYRKVIKHVSTRWLSLELAIERSLKQFPSLKSYFLSTDESQARFIQLKSLFEDPLTEVYLMFLQSVLPTFTHMNQFLQRDEPLIHVLQPQLTKLLKRVLGKFLKAPVLAKAVADDKLAEINFMDMENQVDNKELVIGMMTKQMANKLLEDGDITTNQLKVFYTAIRAFYTRATEYLLKWCPLQDSLLIHSTWIDFEHRLERNFSSVEYFVSLYPNVFVDMNTVKLNDQFIAYQLLVTEEVIETVRQKSGLQNEEDVHRIDDLWSYLATLKIPGTNEKEFDLLVKVSQCVMTIPHSNACEERIFSLINKNKTPSRNSLQADNTLSSLIIVKTHIDDPLKWNPSEALLQKAKKATKTYNEQHRR